MIDTDNLLITLESERRGMDQLNRDMETEWTKPVLGVSPYEPYAVCARMICETFENLTDHRKGRFARRKQSSDRNTQMTGLSQKRSLYAVPTEHRFRITLEPGT
ncbi:hypothetical protein RUM4293_03381 [Ruegeria atlantica]|uniref:Uncharacterized protein n=1 Tax=Ruegeria atlantica TaxID=81569 RepID=A0A0P1ES63_9RHOB|nr:hypothetical protein RUM4293_03381 [Ruegeria atlantica]